jgi:hypothetical protein
MKSGCTTTDRHSYGLLTAATCAAIGTLIPVIAHQIGAIDHLPDPPGTFFASDRITDSKAAHPLGIPDGILGVGSYGATLGLVMMAQSSPAAQSVLALKLAGDGALAGFNVVRQIVSFRKVCSWCTATALCTAVMLYAGRRVIAEEIGMARAWR